MNQITRVTLTFGSFCFFCSSVFGQTTSTVSRPDVPAPATQPSTCSVTFSPIIGIAAPGTRAPYSAVREYSNVKTLADGTHISPKPSSEKIFRDSQNRSRIERPFCSPPTDDPDSVLITIHDPVSGFAYILDSQNHVAHRYTMKVSNAARPALGGQAASEKVAKILASQTSAEGRTSVTETLSPQTMEGVYVTGKRITETIPAGQADNDRPITIVQEEWFSPDLSIPILIKNSDPRVGEVTIRLTNIDRSEPSLSLFEPPPDFKIEDGTERITITYTRH